MGEEAVDLRLLGKCCQFDLMCRIAIAMHQNDRHGCDARIARGAGVRGSAPRALRTSASGSTAVRCAAPTADGRARNSWEWTGVAMAATMTPSSEYRSAEASSRLGKRREL